MQNANKFVHFLLFSKKKNGRPDWEETLLLHCDPSKLRACPALPPLHEPQPQRAHPPCASGTPGSPGSALCSPVAALHGARALAEPAAATGDPGSITVVHGWSTFFSSWLEPASSASPPCLARRRRRRRKSALQLPRFSPILSHSLLDRSLLPPSYPEFPSEDRRTVNPSLFFQTSTPFLVSLWFAFFVSFSFSARRGDVMEPVRENPPRQLPHRLVA